MTSPTSRVLSALALVLALAALTGCSAATPNAGPPADSTPGSPVVAFYGDSYTRGTGATDPSRRWSTLVCEKRGWAEVNPSVDGLGFVNNRELLDNDLVEIIVAEQPEIVIVTMGLNDNFSMPGRASAIEDAITGDLESFADELPDARIIVVEPFWYTDERPRSVDTIIGWVRDSAAAIDAEYISGASRWLEGHPEWMAADGIHPNNDGYAEIASRMDTALTDLGL